MPKLPLDEHLPPAVAEALGKRGIDALPVVRSRLAALPDEHLFAMAAELDRVIVTFNNPDFIAEIARFAAAHPNQQAPGVIFVPGKKIRTSEVSRLASAIEQAAGRIDRGEADARYGLWITLG